MELYNYNFSLYSKDDVNEYGYFGYSHIDDYWNENGRYPYFIRVDGKLAEFFVMQKYRRKGIGKNVAMQIFDMYKGGWEVSQWSENTPAQKFWKL